MTKDDEETCRQCGVVEGSPEYGTVGDGFDGLCPSCADKAEDDLTDRYLDEDGVP